MLTNFQNAEWTERLTGMMGSVQQISSASVLQRLSPSMVQTALASRHDLVAIDVEQRVAFDWRYNAQSAPMTELYDRATRSQWNAGSWLDWSVSVDPEHTEAPLLPVDFCNFEKLHALGLRLSPVEQSRFRSSMARWMLSQFLHGEQGALNAAAQVVASADSIDEKNFAATQVMDEARHVEAFKRYITEKLGTVYSVNDNLHATLNSLVSDSRWDVKLIGMQLIIEGLALTAFGKMRLVTREPLLHSLLSKVLEDEARHVRYGVLVLREHLQGLSQFERHEREDWAFAVLSLLRDRFYAFEVYEEWAHHKLSKAQWREFIDSAAGMRDFRESMYRRVFRNLENIGLFTERTKSHHVQLVVST